MKFTDIREFPGQYRGYMDRTLMPWAEDEIRALVAEVNSRIDPGKIPQMHKRSRESLEAQWKYLLNQGLVKKGYSDRARMDKYFYKPEDQLGSLVNWPVQSSEAEDTNKGATNMNVNTSIMVSLLQEGYNTVEVTFARSDKTYTYKTKEKFSVGDFAVVKADAYYKVVEVVEVHETPQIDINASYEYKWIIQKLDTTAYEAQLVAEEDFIEVLEAVAKEKQKQQVISDFKEFLPKDGPIALMMEEAMKKLVGEKKQIVSAEAVDLATGKRSILPAVACRDCGQVYPANLPACPKCRTSNTFINQ